MRRRWVLRASRGCWLARPRPVPSCAAGSAQRATDWSLPPSHPLPVVSPPHPPPANPPLCHAHSTGMKAPRSVRGLDCPWPTHLFYITPNKRQAPLCSGNRLHASRIGAHAPRRMAADGELYGPEKPRKRFSSAGFQPFALCLKARESAPARRRGWSPRSVMTESSLRKFEGAEAEAEAGPQAGLLCSGATVRHG